MIKLTPNQAHYVLSSLMAQGTVRDSQVRKTLGSREEEIRSLRERLASLEALSAERATSAKRGRPARGGRPAARKARRRSKMSPRVLALRRQQGRYMGYVRRLKATDKARVRSVREKQGIGAAINLAASLGSRA